MGKFPNLNAEEMKALGEAIEKYFSSPEGRIGMLELEKKLDEERREWQQRSKIPPEVWKRRVKLTPA